MRTVEFRRHSFTKKGAARSHGSHLSADGVRAARLLGASLGPFEYVVASTSPRTMETAIAMGFAVAERIPDQGAALVVGHGGWIESVLAQLVAPVSASSAARFGISTGYASA